ncbi:MAG: GNAT family N-acetyltransferase [Chloroflexota bacterium]
MTSVEGRMTTADEQSAISHSSFVIERAVLRDLSAAHALEHACFGRDGWGYFDLFGALIFPGTIRLKAVVDDRLVGFAVGDSRPFDREAWIATIGVHPDYQRRGIGEALLVACEARLREPVIKLTVRASNRAAIALYRKFGYERAGVWHRYYSGGEDGIVMEKNRRQ